MRSVSPVFSEAEVEFEKVIALDQPQYEPIITLPIDLHLKDESGETVEIKQRFAMAVRFRFSDEERKAITAGADLIATELIFGNPFTPLNFQLCKPDERPAL